jgi:hypothetical protein
MPAAKACFYYHNEEQWPFMTPDLYAIQYARTPQEVLALIGRCVAYIRTGPVLALLPEELQDLQVRDEEDIEAWQHCLAQSLDGTSVFTASARFWIAELIEVFSMASGRLNALRALRSARSPANAPERRIAC